MKKAMKTVVILQPSYMPWLGYFEQIYRSDVFVFYCDVQYDNHGWRNRNKIKVPNGWQWLTVPVVHDFGQLINETKINSSDWAKDHCKSIRQNYAKAKFFSDYFPEIESFYRCCASCEDIEEVAEESTKFMSRLLCMDKTKTFVCSKDLKIYSDSVDKSMRLLSICEHFNATNYYSGAASKDYLNVSIFNEAGIKVKFQSYNHPEYRQLHGRFISYMSVLDLVFNEGPNSLKILTGGKS